MAGPSLTTTSVLQCPHGGQVSATASGPASASGAAILRATDGFTISGCSFSTSAGPSPCVTVEWTGPDTRVAAAGGATLSEGSVGLCLNGATAPQGAVRVVSTRADVRTV